VSFVIGAKRAQRIPFPAARWTITFGPPDREPARETNVFEEIERPRRLVYRSTMALPDGSSLGTQTQVTFEPENGKTRLTIVSRAPSRPPSCETSSRAAGPASFEALAHAAAARAAN
jgi:uncharacterized protein YndB with AHSA1/START domain